LAGSGGPSTRVHIDGYERERMKIGVTSMGCVLNRFPEYRLAVQRLLKVNDSFKALCAEYEDCAAALEYWRESALAEAPGLRDEYAILCRELEEELLGYLGNSAR
jgi:hypothetical protein